MVGEHSIEVGNLDVRMCNADGRRDEDEVNLLALECRNPTIIVISKDRTRVVGCHVIGVVEFTT